MRLPLAGLCAVLFAFSAAAAEPPEALTRQLQTLVPGVQPDSIRPTPWQGVYEVAYGAQLFYFSGDGRYMLRGEMMDLNGQVNLTEKRRAAYRVEALAALGEETMLVYSPEKETRHTITVFTDVDCVYCRKLHSGMKEMNDLGIRVRYLAYPRAGVGSSSYNTMRSVWCAEDPQAAMDQAKAGKPVPESSCAEHDLSDHLSLVQEFGLNGTPALVLEDGQLVPGYVPPRQLAQMLEENSAKQKAEAAAKAQ